jgi:exonuclease VII small subunit
VANTESTWESARKEIQEARTELTTMESQLPKAIDTYKAGMTDYYANVVKGLDAEIAARNAKIKSLQDERDKMEDTLDKAGEKQGEINTLLVYAVYAMVLAIVGLFLLLRFFPAELARSIVVERTMIELLSMGFLLLTVIILGTGKLIGAETLGALLGTIAGYIFGQKQGERRGATEERAKMVDLIRKTGDST